MKVLLNDNMFVYRSSGRTMAKPDPHLGLMSLATILRQAGHAPAIVDPKILFTESDFSDLTDAFLVHWARHCLDRAPDIVGFTAYGRTLPFVIRVAQYMREAGFTGAIIIGGPHATIVGRRLMEDFPVFDLVVKYEAENLIVPLVEALATGGSLDHIPNLIYRAGGDLVETGAERDLIDINAIPAPALDFYPAKYLQNCELSVEAGRGCPFACTFCSTAQFFQRRYRLKSNDRILEEMEACRARFGTTFFNMNHDLFGLNKKSLRQFCAMVKDRGFTWKCSMRADTLDLDLLDDLIGAGCVDIYFGIETGSQRLQAVVRKNLDLAKTRAALSLVVDRGLNCTASFITGFPEETVDDQNATLDLIGDLWALEPQKLRTQLHMLSPEPGTSLDAEGRPIRFDGIGPEADVLLDRDMIAAHPEVFSVFYHYPSECPRWRIIAASTFVNFIAPEIGTPFLSHVVRTYFGGRLSSLFAAMVGERPFEFASSSTVTETVAARFLHLIETLSHRPQASYLAELAQVSRVSAEMRALSLSNPEEARDYAWLINCKYDIIGLIRHILSNNPVAVRDCVSAGPVSGAAGRWFLMSYGADFSLQSREMDASAMAAFAGDDMPQDGRGDPICLRIA